MPYEKIDTCKLLKKIVSAPIRDKENEDHHEEAYSAKTGQPEELLCCSWGLRRQ